MRALIEQKIKIFRKFTVKFTERNNTSLRIGEKFTVDFSQKFQ